MPKLYTPEEIVELYKKKLAYTTVLGALRSGRLRGSKLHGHWFVKEADLEAWFEAGVPASAEEQELRVAKATVPKAKKAAGKPGRRRAQPSKGLEDYDLSAARLAA